MNSFTDLQIERDERGVVTVSIDLADRSVNVITENLIRELDAVIHELQADKAARLVVFRSNKKSGFLAGADVHRIAQITSREEAEIVLKLGQELFQRIENLEVPTAAMIHGPCLGGGLELALACQYRFAGNDPSTKIGVPETHLGLIPGWGGTQRLPRLIGLTSALKMILTGRQVSAMEAVQSGLIDRVLGAETFDSDIEECVSELLLGEFHRPVSRGWFSWLRDQTPIGRSLVLKLAQRQIASKARHYPALRAALRAVEVGLKRGMEAGLAREREEFCQLVTSRTSHNLMRAFLDRERARKPGTWVSAETDFQKELHAIGVLGTGTMGAGIAQLAAVSGYGVVIKDVNDEMVQAGIQKIEALMHQAVKKEVISTAEAERALASVAAVSAEEDLKPAGLIIEAIVERLDVKQEVFRELDESLPDDALLTSNTSALPIGELAAATNRPQRVAGLHFFNPVHKMPLVEIVRSSQTSDETVASLVHFVRKLGKTPVVVNDGPGFLVNRILFPYLDEAVRLVLEGLPVGQIDREAKRFGMPMGPLELLDTVGLDVAADVARTLSPLSLEPSPTPEHLEQLVAAGKLGQKSGEGFYIYRKRRRPQPSQQDKSTDHTARVPQPREFAGETITGIQQRLVLSMINEAATCLRDQIAGEAWMVDLAMILGTGFAPFRGGPLSLADHWGYHAVAEALNDLSSFCGPRFKPSGYFNESRSPHRFNKPRTPSTEPVSTIRPKE